MASSAPPPVSDIVKNSESKGALPAVESSDSAPVDPAAIFRWLIESNFEQLPALMSGWAFVRGRDPYELIMLLYPEQKLWPRFFNNNPAKGVNIDAVERICVLLGYSRDWRLQINRYKLLMEIYNKDPRRARASMLLPARMISPPRSLIN
ncbi:MAG: hypothetical protein Sylvanvirus24_2 [Sylvanvirus sp.]|uniref:Uncharacterized protein n=1 Tax=Sylvanvirus sp. TaxID=2487774 RepID=A0A3G5AIR7_9VIRU|nr:MAG: hypothetical protein Sylvanvirus24_2 [Sylvanvirus sp.]